MTPAINTAKKAKITYTLHEYVHDPSSESYGSVKPKMIMGVCIVLN